MLDSILNGEFEEFKKEIPTPKSMNTNSEYCELNKLDTSYKKACIALQTIGIQNPEEMPELDFRIALDQLKQRR